MRNDEKSNITVIGNIYAFRIDVGYGKCKTDSGGYGH